MNHCSECGAELPAGTRFCPVGSATCPIVAAATQSPSHTDHTTAAIDVGALDPEAPVTDAPAPAAGTAVLVVVRGPNAGSRFLLDRDVTSIGRHPDSDIFLDDVTVSRRHVELRREAGVFVVHDLGSLNGTYVAGERVEQRPLANGDEFQVGRFKMVLVAGNDPA